MARPASGHLYFTLKDARAQLRAAMFRMKAQYLKFVPREGMRVLVRGKVTLCDARGEYQMVLDPWKRRAKALRRAFEELKARLEAEGLFDPARKRHCCACTTSGSDHLADRRRRARCAERARPPFPAAGVDLLPTLVQGSSAARRSPACCRRPMPVVATT